MNRPADDALRHCCQTIRSLIAARADQRRCWLQLGYNLGRLSELTGAGRAVWDAWKEPAAQGDWTTLARLADALESDSAQP
ncbi:MAG: hypothetical protein KatS3mg108_1788 [Isosphaeraceae bacterium]|jgi:hypothetical protein|nr:MAG: hypothetical protein KatS3mg108_1788 [Isosphaeraceae bacterium]